MIALNYEFLVQPTRMEGKNSYCVVKCVIECVINKLKKQESVKYPYSNYHVHGPFAFYILLICFNDIDYIDYYLFQKKKFGKKMLPSTLDMAPSPSTWNPRPSTLDKKIDSTKYQSKQEKVFSTWFLVMSLRKILETFIRFFLPFSTENTSTRSLVRSSL